MMYLAPFLGTWDNPTWLGFLLRKKTQPIQLDFNTRTNFVNQPLSNFYLLNFVYLRGAFSRDNLPNAITKECGIVNLDNKIGPDTHWVCYRITDNNWLFDNDIQKFMVANGKQIVYSGDEIQERDSVLCGYWCLYYLLRDKKKRSILQTMHNSEFDM